MGLFRVLGDDLQCRPARDAAGALARRHGLVAANKPRTEVLAHQCHYLVVVDISRDRNDHPLRRVATHVERMQLRPGHRRDRRRAADHRPPDGMRAEHRRQEDVAEGVLGIVVAHRDLLEHHVALDLDIVCGTTPPQHHVGNQVDGQFQIGVEHVRVVARVLSGGERVQLTADGVDGLRDLDRRARRRRLEQQVFQEVRGTGNAGPLVAGTDVDPHPDRGRMHRRNVLGDHAQATGQCGATHLGKSRR